jgi:hypothetical protein
MKVRAAVWYQGWGKGQTCEQVDGENVSSTCYRRQTERTKGRDERVSKIMCTACKFVTFGQCFQLLCICGGQWWLLEVKDVKGQMRNMRAKGQDFQSWGSILRSANRDDSRDTDIGGETSEAGEGGEYQNPSQLFIVAVAKSVVVKDIPPTRASVHYLGHCLQVGMSVPIDSPTPRRHRRQKSVVKTYHQLGLRPFYPLLLPPLPQLHWFNYRIKKSKTIPTSQQLPRGVPCGSIFNQASAYHSKTMGQHLQRHIVS